jgi:ABC-type nitrate/sulfonate/bicarbonate transport system substrate-binding protein
MKIIRTGTAAGLLAAALAVQPVLAEGDATPVRWGVAVNASLSHMLAPLLELDEEVQARHGIDFTTVDFGGNVMNCIAAILSDLADVCQNGITVGMNAIAQGGDFKGFMQQIGQITEITISTSTMQRLGITADAPINERVAALKGLRVAGPPPGTTNHYLMDAILQEAGLSITDVQYQPLADLAALNASLANDRVDAAIWSVGGLSPSQADGTGVRFISLANNDIPFLRTVPNVAVYASTAYVTENRELLQRVQAAFVDVVAKLQADPFGYAAGYKAKHLPALDETAWNENLPQAVAAFIPDVEGTKDGWDFWIKRLDADSDDDFSRAYYDQAFFALKEPK